MKFPKESLVARVAFYKEALRIVDDIYEAIDGSDYNRADKALARLRIHLASIFD